MTTPGALIVGGTAGAPGALPVGTNGQHLVVTAGAPAWQTPPADVGFANPMSGPGDLIVGGAAGAATRLAVGATTQVLTLVGSAPTWVAPTYGGMTNPMTTPGDLIAGGAGGAANRLAVGLDGQVLSVVGGVSAWAAPAAPANLLTNPGLEVWQRGAGPFTNAALSQTADQWQASASTSTFSLTRVASTVGTPGYSAQVVYTHGGAGFCHLLQKPENWAALAGATLSFAATVKASVAGRVRLWVND